MKRLKWWFCTETGRANLARFFKDFWGWSIQEKGKGWRLYGILTLMLQLVINCVAILFHKPQLTLPQQALLYIASYCATVLFFLWLSWLDFHPSIVTVVNVKKLREKAAKQA